MARVTAFLLLSINLSTCLASVLDIQLFRAALDVEEPLNSNEDEAVEFLRGYDELGSVLANLQALAQWEYTTNINDENSEALKQRSLKVVVDFILLYWTCRTSAFN